MVEPLDELLPRRTVLGAEWPLGYAASGIDVVEVRRVASALAARLQLAGQVLEVAERAEIVGVEWYKTNQGCDPRVLYIRPQQRLQAHAPRLGLQSVEDLRVHALGDVCGRDAAHARPLAHGSTAAIVLHRGVALPPGVAERLRPSTATPGGRRPRAKGFGTENVPAPHTPANP